MSLALSAPPPGTQPLQPPASPHGPFALHHLLPQPLCPHSQSKPSSLCLDKEQESSHSLGRSWNVEPTKPNHRPLARQASPTLGLVHPRHLPQPWALGCLFRLTIQQALGLWEGPLRGPAQKALRSLLPRLSSHYLASPTVLPVASR